MSGSWLKRVEMDSSVLQMSDSGWKQMGVDGSEWEWIGVGSSCCEWMGVCGSTIYNPILIKQKLSEIKTF